MRRILHFIYGCVASIVLVSCLDDLVTKKPRQTDMQIAVDTTVSKKEIVQEPIIEEEPEPVKVVEKEKYETKPKSVEIAVPAGAPSFSNINARKYVRDYETYISNYRKAVNAEGMEAFIELDEAGTNLTRQYRNLLNELSPDELEKMSRYMKEKTNQIDRLTQQM